MDQYWLTWLAASIGHGAGALVGLLIVYWYLNKKGY